MKRTYSTVQNGGIAFSVILTLFMFSFTYTYAQSLVVTGEVVDTTGAPVPGASVVIQYQGQSTEYATTVNYLTSIPQNQIGINHALLQNPGY